ncbi:MAG: hypothetical protein ACI4SA_07245, partial [Lachnospiraceae bacterium]
MKRNEKLVFVCVLVLFGCCLVLSVVQQGKQQRGIVSWAKESDEKQATEIKKILASSVINNTITH